MQPAAPLWLECPCPQEQHQRVQDRKELPWWLRGEDSTCQCRRYRSDSWSGKIPHAAEQLSPRCCLVAQSYLILCDPTDCSPPGSSVRGIPQARILEWVAILSSRESPQPRDQTHKMCIAERFFTTEPPGKTKWAPAPQLLSLCSGAQGLQPSSHSYWSPRALEPVLCNKRSHCNEMHAPLNWSVAPTHWN